MSSHERAVEARELVGILQTTKFATFVNVLQREPDCFFNDGKINCASAARYLGVAAPKVREMMAELRGLQLG